MNKKKVLSFGEILLRYALPSEQNWLSGASINAYLGGAEMNVGVALAQWGDSVKYCSAVPDNFLGKQLINNLENAKIDTSAMQIMGDRVGVYYVPEGEDVKNAGVFYDRANSAFSQLKTGQINWEAIMEDCDWFHFSAIAAALNHDVTAVCHEALEVAQRKGLTISLDLNYRSKLWQYVPSPIPIMQPLAAYCDVIMGNVWAANTLLGVALGDAPKDRFHKENCLSQAHDTAQNLFALYPKLQTIANTYRFTEGEYVHYYATLHDKKHDFCSETHETNSVIDKVGSGDCFMAALIYGLRQNLDYQKIIAVSASAAFYKLQEKGDATQQKNPFSLE
jgi:2-dehydro-3-deoxygluconokinase